MSDDTKDLERRVSRMSLKSRRRRRTQELLSSPLARLPPVPANTDGRYCAFGWPLTDEWIDRFLDRTEARTRGIPKELENPTVLAMMRLRSFSRYPHIYHFRSLRDGVPLPDGPADEKSDQFMFAICFTSSKYMYYRRPTEKQFEWLKRQFPGEPQWYRDAIPKEFWLSHGIETYI